DVRPVVPHGIEYVGTGRFAIGNKEDAIRRGEQGEEE
ncbi:MAG: hypothetical protein ACI9TH_004422, partial [Kiritimatiellia bacterium]